FRSSFIHYLFLLPALTDAYMYQLQLFFFHFLRIDERPHFLNPLLYRQVHARTEFLLFELLGFYNQFSHHEHRHSLEYLLFSDEWKYLLHIPSVLLVILVYSLLAQEQAMSGTPPYIPQLNKQQTVPLLIQRLGE